MFLNGRRLIGNYPWQNLEQMISGELNYQKTAQNAGEKCCEVKIPNPLNKIDASSLPPRAGRRIVCRRAEPHRIPGIRQVPGVARNARSGHRFARTRESRGIHPRPISIAESAAAQRRQLLPGFRSHHQRPSRPAQSAEVFDRPREADAEVPAGLHAVESFCRR